MTKLVSHCWYRIWMRKLELREAKKHSQSHTAWAEPEAVGKSRVLPGRHGLKLRIGILDLSLGCCVTLGNLPPSLNSISSPRLERIAKPTF